MQVAEEDAPLFSALKAKRRALAEAARVPAYVIFPDRTLRKWRSHRPQTLDDMARMNGVGAKKLESYGEAFLSVIAGAPRPCTRRAGRWRAAMRARCSTASPMPRCGWRAATDGTEKPLSCSTGQLKRIAETRPASHDALGRIIDQPRLDRFGDAFLTDITSKLTLCPARPIGLGLRPLNRKEAHHGFG
jgi:ATP-dependent DNA helicase RecQ